MNKPVILSSNLCPPGASKASNRRQAALEAAAVLRAVLGSRKREAKLGTLVLRVLCQKLMMYNPMTMIVN